MNAVRICYQTVEFEEVDIHIRSLRDKQQFSDPFGEAEALGISSAQWSLFGVLWESSKVLAKEMEHFNIDNKRILEVGCGIGLTSLLLNSRQADITATDYHPEASTFLTENTRLNSDETIPFLRTAWQDEHDGLGTFDLIIGADLLYEAEHITLLSEFIDRHTNPHCEIILVDPGRGNHAQFSKAMVEKGYTHHQHKPEGNEDFKGMILKYKR